MTFACLAAASQVSWNRSSASAAEPESRTKKRQILRMVEPIDLREGLPVRAAEGEDEVAGRWPRLLLTREAQPCYLRISGHEPVRPGLCRPKEARVVNFFVEGGWGMYPVLVMDSLLVGAGFRYARDGEPIRLRFIGALGLALVVTMIDATWTCVAAVFRFLETVPEAEFRRTLMTGLMESTRPAVLGGALLALALTLVAVGAYRLGQRELRAISGR